MKRSVRPMAFLLGILVLAAHGCGDSGSNPAAPNPDSRGTPLGAPGTFDISTSFVWSAATNEIVGKRAPTFTTPGGLIGVYAVLGTSRVIDHDHSATPIAPASGTPVYYQGRPLTSADSVVLRRVSLTGGAPVRIEAAPWLHVFVHRVSADGGWLAWTVGPQLVGTPDSITIQNTVSRIRTRIAPGIPELMSPDGSQLIYSRQPTAFPPPLVLYDRGTGSSAPFDLGLPAGAAPAGMRWDAAGVHALFVMAQQQVWVRHVATGVEEHLYDSSDTLLAFSGSWSPDGSHVALWGVSQAVTPARQNLHVVDVAAKAGSIAAYGDLEQSDPPLLAPPSGIVFSPDSRTMAYQYGDQLFTADVRMGPSKLSARATGVRRAR